MGTVEQNIPYGIEGLLIELSPEIMNFRDEYAKFRDKIGKTFILSPYGSKMFGLSVIDGIPVLAVPNKLWKHFKALRIDSISTVPKELAVFLVVQYSPKQEERGFLAIRIGIPNRVFSRLNEFHTIRSGPVDSSGYLIEAEGFDVALKSLDSMIWDGQEGK